MSPRLIPRNPLSRVPVWVPVAAVVLGCAWLGLPVWAWPIPLLALYVVHVLVVPMAPCRWCDGGKKFGLLRGTRSRRPCSRCGGSGERVRWAMFRSTEQGGGGGFSL